MSSIFPSDWWPNLCELLLSVLKILCGLKKNAVNFPFFGMSMQSESLMTPFVYFTNSAKYIDPTRLCDLCLYLTLSCGKEPTTKKWIVLLQIPFHSNPLWINLSILLVPWWCLKARSITWGIQWPAMTPACAVCAFVETGKKNQTSSAVLGSHKNKTLYSLAARNSQQYVHVLFWLTQTEPDIYFGILNMPLFCLPPPGFECLKGTVFRRNYYFFYAQQVPTCFKADSMGLAWKTVSPLQCNVCQWHSLLHHGPSHL